MAKRFVWLLLMLSVAVAIAISNSGADWPCTAKWEGAF